MQATIPQAVLTVPALAEVLRVRVDWLRRELGRRPDVRGLFVVIGPHRALLADRLPELRAALGIAQPEDPTP